MRIGCPNDRPASQSPRLDPRLPAPGPRLLGRKPVHLLRDSSGAGAALGRADAVISAADTRGALLTAGLLVSVLAITLLAGTGYRTLAPSFRDYMELQYGSDLQVDSGSRFGGTALPEDYVDRAQAVPGVDAVTPMWHTRTEVSGIDGDRILTAIDPATHFGPAGYLFVDGDVDAARAGLDHGGVLVSHLLAEEEGWQLGHEVELLVGGRAATFTVAATYSSFGDDYSRAFVIGRADAERTLGAPLGGPNEIRVDVADGIDTGAVAAALPPLDNGRQLRIRFGEENVSQAVDQFNGVFSLFVVLQAVAAIVGLLGIANTMAISVLERTREIGVLRALGTRIAEVRRMVFVEVLVLVAVALVVAVGASWLLARDIGGSSGALFGFTGAPSYPWAWVPVLGVLAAVAATGASAAPARRAARIDLCEALRLD